MSEDIPNKADIAAVFKRLRAIPSNKTCFDCGAKNPTWSSVTYGVFICMDCSAVHRSLGVHVSFVRSTQLDTNWTWLQLRGMQIGGNANATVFFQQHGCTSTDAQQKYNSRAAQLYREKVHHSAHAAMRLHGTKVHIDTGSSSESHVGTPENKEVDFFQEIAQTSQKFHCPETENNLQNGSALHNVTLVAQDNGETGEGPKVESLLSSSPTAEGPKVSEPRKATIGSRKPTTNKKGVGTRKGLGAQKVSSNFNEIEQQAQRVDQMKEQARQQQITKPLSPMEEQQHIASVRLAYQDLSIQQKQTEEKMRQTDPRKAEHLERLGMGFRTPGLTGTKSISHSAASNMKVIQQETPTSGSSSSTGSSSLLRSRDLDDDFEFVGFTSGPPKYGDSPFLSRLESKERNSGPGNRDLWDDNKMDQKSSFIETILPLEKDDSAGRSRRGISSSSSTSALTSSSSSSQGDQAQKKFGNAKSISSEQFFGPSRDFDYERRANLAKFEGSSSISSADYFGGGMQTRNMDQNFAGPNLYDIKEGVKDGVSKVAGRLSSLANGVMTSLQEKYGY